MEIMYRYIRGDIGEERSFRTHQCKLGCEPRTIEVPEHRDGHAIRAALAERRPEEQDTFHHPATTSGNFVRSGSRRTPVLTQ